MRFSLIGVILLNIGIFLSLLIYPILFTSQNKSFYQYHFNNLPLNTGFDYQTNLEISNKITNYLITGQGLPVELMSSRAVVHMLDVRDIFYRAIFLPVLLIISAMFFLIMSGKQIKYRHIIPAPLIILAFLLTLLLGQQKVFNFIFLKFHLLFYTNDLWMLDDNDLLLKLYPEEFFFRLTYFSGAITLLVSFILLAVLIYNQNKEKNNAVRNR